MSKNPILASFDQQPVLIAEGFENQIEAFLDQAFATQTEVDQMLVSDPPQMSDGYWPDPSSWMARHRPYNVSGGILQIPIRGMLLNGFSLAASWATGYQYINKALERGLADPAVEGIALVIDSGGGDVRGNFDLVDRIYAARGTKPIRAYASENAFSAAYSIASAADSITVARTGGVGSIGIMRMHMERSKELADRGIKVTIIHFGKYKAEGNSYEPLSAAAQARIQERIDGLGEVFVSTVARNRGMSEKAVRNTEALTFSATQATSNGLADAIGSLDDAIAAFAADLSKEDDTMTTKTGTAAANAQAVTYDQAALDAARAEGLAAGVTQGATAEKDRINAILASAEGADRPIAAMAAAMKTSMTVEQATEFLGALTKEVVAPAANPDAEAAAPKGAAGAATDFAAAMANADHPNLGAPAETGNAQMSRAERALSMTGKKKRSAA